MKLLVCFLLLLPFLVIFGFANSAFAYIDPGSGSMLLQLLLGGIAGAIVVLKLYWHKFIGLFRKKPSRESGGINTQDQK